MSIPQSPSTRAQYIWRTFFFGDFKDGNKLEALKLLAVSVVTSAISFAAVSFAFAIPIFLIVPFLFGLFGVDPHQYFLIAESPGTPRPGGGPYPGAMIIILYTLAAQFYTGILSLKLALYIQKRFAAKYLSYGVTLFSLMTVYIVISSDPRAGTEQYVNNLVDYLGLCCFLIGLMGCFLAIRDLDRVASGTLT